MIYLDYAAATPMDEQVCAAMLPYFSDAFYNPSSSYMAAKEVRQALHDARAKVAHWLGAKPPEIIFTAGATESIHLAISGVANRFANAHVAVTAIEHEAVLAAAKPYDPAIVPVLPNGTVDLDALHHAITDDTVLVSVGYANNEVGTVQSLKNVAALVQQIRRMRYLRNILRPLYVHTDASQAACYLDLHASRLGVDMLTLNGGKMYGPKQTGILFVKAGVELAPLIGGGGQEMGLRSGTENVAGYIGLATALDIAQNQRKKAGDYITTLRSELLRHIRTQLPNTQVNGNPKRQLPHILHLSWSGIDGERLVMLLDERGLMASTGSACAANKQTASHVLQALGLNAAAIAGSLRLSLGRHTTPDDIQQAATLIVDAVKSLA